MGFLLSGVLALCLCSGPLVKGHVGAVCIKSDDCSPGMVIGVKGKPGDCCPGGAICVIGKPGDCCPPGRGGCVKGRPGGCCPPGRGGCVKGRPGVCCPSGSSRVKGRPGDCCPGGVSRVKDRPGDCCPGKMICVRGEPGESGVIVQATARRQWTTEDDQPPVMKLKGPSGTIWVTKGGQPGAAVIQAGPQMICLSAAGAGDDEEERILAREAPSHWIGVCLSPVPEPLATHIGSDGIMTVNVVKDSPADQTGLKQYDVIVAFGGRKIKTIKDLCEAVGEVEAGDETAMVVIREGKKRRLVIVPVERPEAGTCEYVYEQPQEEVIDQRLGLRGQRLRRGPSGEWIIDQLGPLCTVPDVLKKLKDLDLHGWALDLDRDDLDLDLDIDFDIEDLDDLEHWVVRVPDSDDADVRVEIRIQVDDDGNLTTIRRDLDGKIHVERRDADGDESSETYGDVDEFREADPEAYRLYRSHSGRGRRAWMWIRPEAGKLKDLQKKFQIQVETRLEDAVKRSKEAQRAARDAAREARRKIRTLRREHRGDEDAGEMPTKVRILRREHASDAEHGAKHEAEHEAETLSIRIDDEGRITVTTTKDGERTTYTFDSKAEFKKSKPKLYQKVRSVFE